MKNLLPLFLLFVGFTAMAQKQMPNVSLSNLDGKKVSVTTDFMEKDNIYKNFGHTPKVNDQV